jgi:hypothetical protein
MFHIVIL